MTCNHLQTFPIRFSVQDQTQFSRGQEGKGGTPLELNQGTWASGQGEEFPLNLTGFCKSGLESCAYPANNWATSLFLYFHAASVFGTQILTHSTRNTLHFVSKKNVKRAETMSRLSQYGQIIWNWVVGPKQCVLKLLTISEQRTIC